MRARPNAGRGDRDWCCAGRRRPAQHLRPSPGQGVPRPLSPFLHTPTAETLNSAPLSLVFHISPPVPPVRRDIGRRRTERGAAIGWDWLRSLDGPKVSPQLSTLPPLQPPLPLDLITRGHFTLALLFITPVIIFVMKVSLLALLSVSLSALGNAHPDWSATAPSPAFSPALAPAHLLHPAQHRFHKRASAPVVSLSQARYKGSTSSSVDAFKGIPYVLAPTGTRRWATPVAITASSTATVAATAYGSKCTVAEDCLKLNVFRPEGTVSGAGLPVLVYFFGGSFSSGDGSAYNPTNLIKRGIATGQKVLVVTFNYRLGALGFLNQVGGSSTISKNLGLYDQAAALAWIQANIARFGGDPAKVTAWGQSAGAISIALQMFNAPGAPPFRAAILHSGAAGTVEVFDRTSSWPTAQQSTAARYKTFLAAVGCSTGSIACLRKATLAKVLAAQIKVNAAAGGFPWGPVEDSAFLPGQPSALYAEKAFADVPVIIGNVLDEGTLFINSGTYVGSNISTNTQVQSWLATMFPNQTSTAIAELEAAYSDSQSEGSPYNTGSTEYKWAKYKKVSSIFGDVAFHAPRRQFLNAAYARQQCWSFLFVSPASTTTAALGVGHGSDLQVAFAKIASPSAEETALMQVVNDYWLNFAATLDPNGETVEEWSRWTYSGRAMMQLGVGGDTKAITDDFRTTQTGKIVSKAEEVRIGLSDPPALWAWTREQCGVKGGR